MQTHELEVAHPNGPLRFTCFDNWVSRMRSRSILEGQTYPPMSFIDDVATVVDVGANCGATSVFFSAQYPQATVHALEPASEPYELLSANARGRSNIIAHRLGLHAKDQDLPLYRNGIDSGTASVIPNGSEPIETVRLRAAADWLREQEIQSIDVLKVDVEGCEMEVLESMVGILPSVQVLYVEYGGFDTRRKLDRMLEPTHVMALGSIMLTHGEAAYIARRLADDQAATSIGLIVRDRMQASLRDN